MIMLPTYRALDEYTTYTDFIAIPVEVFNEIQVVANYSLEEAYQMLEAAPRYYTNYTQTSLGGTRVVSYSDVKRFLNNFNQNCI